MTNLTSTKILTAPIFIAILLLSACKPSSGDESEEKIILNPPDPPEPAAKTVNFIGEFTGETEITVEEIGNDFVFQGDMIVRENTTIPTDNVPSDGVLYGLGISTGSFRWANGVIPYRIDSRFSASNRRSIAAAISHWEDNTPIRFVDVATVSASKRGGNFVTFTPAPNGVCLSNVGRIGGEQFIHLDLIEDTRVCAQSAIIHEIGHTVGLMHEQSRCDRDDYVTVIPENADELHPSQRVTNFARKLPLAHDIGEYDYRSIMHYSKFAFSSTSLPTIVPTNSGFDSIIGKGSGLSVGDIQAVKSMYPMSFFPARTSLASFTYNTWDANVYPIKMGDVDGDGRDDVIGFGRQDVYVSYATDGGFSAPISVLRSFVLNSWPFSIYPVRVGDVDGDGRDDIIGFGKSDVYVSFSNGSGFNPPVSVLNSFVLDTWPFNTYPVKLGDVNGDGKDDIIGFGRSDVYVSLSNGLGFDAPIAVLKSFVLDSWDFSKYPIRVGDVNGDGREDIIGFGRTDLYVSFSNGTSFDAPVAIGSPFVYENSWGGEVINGFFDNRLKVGDFNGDNRVDIIAFGFSDVFISFSRGGSFSAPQAILDGTYTLRTEWNPSIFPRRLGDINGDGKLDVIGFGRTNIYVSTQKSFEREALSVNVDPLCAN